MKADRPSVTMDEPELTGLAKLMGGPPRSVNLLAGGRNSRVYRVEDASGGRKAFKVYFRHPGDVRDRLGSEWAAMVFMREQGLTCVPAPLVADPEAGLALYEFIEGERPLVPSATELDQAAAFLVRLHGLRGRPGAGDLPLASEARFSLAEVAGNVETRLGALREGAPELAGFLAGELEPVWRDLLAQALDRSREAGVDFAAGLAPDLRTLSPSDFGFHNALRRRGRLVFLDFEYFGWDDPAKLIADFLLHPGMDLALSDRARVAERVLVGLGDVPGLRTRARIALPLFAIKWCTILLNEFLPGALERRRFADPSGAIRERQPRQLEKTRKLLQWIQDGHDPLQPAP